MNLLKKKIVLVTGGSRGIGKQIIKTFVKQGAKAIFFTFKSYLDKYKKFEDELYYKYPYVKVKGYKSDCTNLNSVKKTVKKILKYFKRIDVLVNNVGIKKDSLLLNMKEKDWDTVIKTNLTTIFYVTKEVAKNMIKNRNGSIINIGSIVGLIGNFGQCNYSTSKSGIIGFTKSIALELGSRNIRCNVVSPGLIFTDMIKSLSKKKIKEWKNRISLKRIGNVKDVANACLFLASDLSSYITGEILNVNGGISS
jgi:3-oxoacyl-[acyl-carrier protein] reductase